MLDISSARVAHCVVHQVGNRLREEGCEFSEGAVKGTAELHGTLLRNYLAPLAKAGEEFEFYHESDLSLNASKQFSSRILVDPTVFLNVSQNIAKHLYSVSTNPSISGGEFIAILFQDVRINDESCFALGLYKIEQRETYLEVEKSNGSLNLVELSGISVSNIQKGALIVGNDLHVLVKESGGQQTKYWAELFLKVRPRQTIKSTSKIAAELIKQVCSKVDVEAGMSYRRDLADVFSNNESIEYEKMKEISQRYLNENEVSKITQQLVDSSGFSSLPTSAVDVGLLKRHAKNSLRKHPIVDGVEITISKPNAHLKNCSINKTKSGYRAIIDIEME